MNEYEHVFPYVALLTNLYIKPTDVTQLSLSKSRHHELNLKAFLSL